jgi:hypothetical protein
MLVNANFGEEKFDHVEVRWVPDELAPTLAIVAARAGGDAHFLFVDTSGVRAIDDPVARFTTTVERSLPITGNPRALADLFVWLGAGELADPPPMAVGVTLVFRARTPAGQVRVDVDLRGGAVAVSNLG